MSSPELTLTDYLTAAESTGSELWSIEMRSNRRVRYLKELSLAEATDGRFTTTSKRRPSSGLALSGPRYLSLDAETQPVFEALSVQGSQKVALFVRDANQFGVYGALEAHLRDHGVPWKHVSRIEGHYASKRMDQLIFTGAVMADGDRRDLELAVNLERR